MQILLISIAIVCLVLVLCLRKKATNKEFQKLVACSMIAKLDDLGQIYFEKE